MQLAGMLLFIPLTSGSTSDVDPHNLSPLSKDIVKNLLRAQFFFLVYILALRTGHPVTYSSTSSINNIMNGA